ncbi:MAG: hypothetical protein ACE37K_16000 [Planctomycetota bacterium]
MSSTNARMHPLLAALLWIPWGILLALALCAVVWFVYAVSQRLLYPHELEWMEGALADHASRVADGLPLYCEPTAEHVPFLYSPLLFWLGALGMKLGIDGIVALRLVAVGFSVSSAMLIGHWVRVESRQLVPGLVATGMFLAGYGWLAWWFDLARNDSLFVFLSLSTAYQLRHGGERRWLWAGLLAAVALLAKQSALMWLPAVGVGCLCWNWRVAVKFGVTSAVAMAASVGALHLVSDGWSTFYLFEMPSHHGIVGDRKLGFWTEDLVPIVPLLVLSLLGFVGYVRFRPREALFFASVGAGSLVTSYLSRMHVGGFDNVMMYVFAGACLLGASANGGLARHRVDVLWLRVLAPLLLLGQFGWLGYEAWHRGTSTLLPSDAHRKAHDELRTLVERQDGPVWIPAHGHIAYRAGKGTGAHGQAIFDVMQLLPKLPNGMFDLAALTDDAKLAHLPERGRLALHAVMTNTTEALAERHFAALVIDEIGAGVFPVLFAAGLVGPDGRFGTADDPYVRRPGPAIANPTAIKPLLGFDVHTPYLMQRK